MAPPLTESNIKLAALLRECAAYVEQNKFDPAIFKALGGLHEYAATATSSTNTAIDDTMKPVDNAPPEAALANKQELTKPYVMPGGLGSLGKQFKKGLGISMPAPTPSVAHQQATSLKNAERTKADLEGDWCDVHFAKGCACKARGPISASASFNSRTASYSNSNAARPSFSRPTNPGTNLIANGWIVQQRRSKMRIVWKDILASLVEGRKPGEEATLWIQREVSNSSTGKMELEALHQIPVKWLEDVKYLDFYGDHRFSIKVYNVTEDFLFKCADEESAQNWVLTLLSMKEMIAQKKNMPATVQHTPESVTVTANPTTNTTNNNANGSSTEPPKMSIKELRAVAHGAGINTAGMERSDLEKAVKSIAEITPEQEAQRQQDVVRQQEAQRQQQQQQQQQDEARRREETELLFQRQQQEEERQRVAAAMTATVRKAAEESEAKRAAERQRLDAAERQRAEEEQRRVWQQQQAEQRRRQEEAARAEAARAEAARLEAAKLEAARQEAARYAQQQQWTQQQAAQQAYAAQQQQWAQQQQAQAQAAHAAATAAWQQQQQQQQQQQYRAQQANKFPAAPPQPPSSAAPPAPPPPSASAASSKYAKMASEGDGQAAITNLKRNILVHWALQPPMLQSLRQIHHLLLAVHNVFPPAFGVPGHEYFGKWKAITAADVGGATVDEELLKKAVKKLRFFLHPDKLPKDLNEEQTFMCKMLWDVANDSWEEHNKRKEELDWMKH